MDRELIIEKIEKILSEDIELNLSKKIKESDKTWEDLGVDSIMAMQLVVYLEDEFDIEVPEDYITQDIFDTVGSLVDFVLKLQEEKV